MRLGLIDVKNRGQSHVIISKSRIPDSLGLDVRKPVFGVSDKARLKPVTSVNRLPSESILYKTCNHSF